MRRTAVIASLALLVAVSCGSDGPAESDPLAGVTIAGDVVVRVVAEGFSGPTQIAHRSDGSLLVAELNGAENAGVGRVLTFELASPEDRTVLQRDLDKPTGVAELANELWIMERQRLSRAGLDPGAERVVVLDELPSNGRSQGTLTPSPAGDLLYNTSGKRVGNQPAEGSAALFALDPASESSTVVATGFKHAYAHHFAPDGVLWVTEVTDGSYDGEPAVDELVPVVVGDDFGWPACVDSQRPVTEFGGTAERCDATPPSHVLFPPTSTPTSVVVAPWDADVLLVALWLEGEIVAASAAAPGEYDVLVSGLQGPQHLLVDGDRVLLTEHQTGRVLAIGPS